MCRKEVGQSRRLFMREVCNRVAVGKPYDKRYRERDVGYRVSDSGISGMFHVLMLVTEQYDFKARTLEQYYVKVTNVKLPYVHATLEKSSDTSIEFRVNVMTLWKGFDICTFTIVIISY